MWTTSSSNSLILALLLSCVYTFDFGFDLMLQDSLEQVLSPQPLQINRGIIPKWLSGTYVRQVPGLHNFSNHRLEHMFDGFSKLHLVSFNNGEASIVARFLPTSVYNASQESGALPPIFTLGPVTPPWTQEERLKSLVTIDDNTAINTFRFRSQDNKASFVAAVTDALMLQIFDEKTGALIETRGYDLFGHVTGPDTRGRLKTAIAMIEQGKLKPDTPNALDKFAVMATAHPLEDIQKADKVWNVASVINPFAVVSPKHFSHCMTLFYTHSNGSSTVVASIPTPRVHYIHSFGLTEHYAVLAMWPVSLDLGSFLEKGQILDALEFDASSATRVVLIELNSGRVVVDAEAPPFFAYHFVNCYEQVDADGGRSVVADVSHFNDTSTMGFWKYDLVRNATYRDFYPAGDSFIRRMVVPVRPKPAQVSIKIEDIRSFTSDGEPLSGPQLPRINDAVQGRRYCFVYGYSGHAFGLHAWSAAAVVKTDLCHLSNSNMSSSSSSFLNSSSTSSAARADFWFRESMYPSEAVFVPHPSATSEDDGVLIVDAFNGHAEKSLIFILDARNMQELAILESPVRQSWPLHGNFFSSE